MKDSQICSVSDDEDKLEGEVQMKDSQIRSVSHTGSLGLWLLLHSFFVYHVH